METWYGAAVWEEAKNRSRGREQRRISAIHAGVSAGVALAITLLQLVLSAGIEKTGGLSGMGMRSILQTAGTLLQTANTALTPFWSLGFLFAALQWTRQKPARPADLLTGFHRIGGYLRLLLSKGLLMIAVGLFCAYASSFIYMMTPWAEPVMEFAQSVGMNMETANAQIAQMDLAQMDLLLHSMIPMLVIWGVLLLLILVPMLYKYRMAAFFVLDEKRMGGLAAMLLSARMLRKRRWKLFLLDLRFWWYYALQALCAALYFADLWLPLLGVTLPATGLGLSLGLYVLYLASLFAVQTLLRPQVETAYALVYERLLAMEPVMPKVQAAPKHMPWDDETAE